MRWQCAECGECDDGARPPTVCSSCGIAGGMFVLREPEPDDPGADDPRAMWARLGLDADVGVEARWNA